MPNYTSARYMFEGGYDVWALDCEKSNVKKEIRRCGDEMWFLRKAAKKEIASLVETFKDDSLYKLRRGDRDWRISRKLRVIWEELEEAEEVMLDCGRQLQIIQSEIDQYRHT